MTGNPHFEAVPSWQEAESRLVFKPVVPKNTPGHSLEAIRIYVRDHKMRELSPADRILEAHYGAFVVSESKKSADDARRAAIEVSYGRESREALIDEHAARIYELGPNRHLTISMADPRLL